MAESKTAHRRIVTLTIVVAILVCVALVVIELWTNVQAELAR